MSTLKQELTKEHLQQLFEENKLRQTKPYLDALAKFDPKTQKVITATFQICFIHKKTTPIGAFTALKFYRQLLLHSELQFLQSDSFNEQIHTYIVKGCKYDAKNIKKERGKKFLIEEFKADDNNQNQSLGYAFCRLCLEIVLKMSQWYPIDLITLEESRFKRYHESLIELGVIFPTNCQYMDLKAQNRFKKNLQKLKDQLQKVQEEIMKEQIEKSKIKEQQTKDKLKQIQEIKQREEQKIKDKNKALDESQKQPSMVEKVSEDKNNQQNIKIQENRKKAEKVKKQISNSKNLRQQFQQKQSFNESPITKMSTHQNEENSNEKTLLNQLNIVIHKSSTQNKSQNQNKDSETKKDDLLKTKTNEQKRRVKIQKMEHLPSKDISQKIQEIKEFTSENKIQLKRNSISTRKIERKNDNQQSYQANKLSINHSDAQLKGRTLSQYRLQKKSNFEKMKDSLDRKCDINNPVQIKTNSLIMYIERLKLRQTVLPFLGEYFLPVSRSMQSLLSESVKLADFPSSQSSKPFYENSIISARMIKQKDNFILSLRNQSFSKIEVVYSRKIQEQCCDSFAHQIKIKSLRLLEENEVLVWEIMPAQYVDITLTFKTSDPNFRFLSMGLLVQNQPIILYLPITLLDEGKIIRQLSPSIITKLDSINARIIKSEPFRYCKDGKMNTFKSKLNEKYLPDFFGISHQGPELLGQMTYTLKVHETLMITISVYILRVPSSKCEIYAVYDRRISENEDYAKVLIELLYLLLTAKRS